VAVKIPKIKKRKSFGARLTAALMALAAMAIIAFLAFSNWRIWNNRRDLDAGIKDLQNQVQVLEEHRRTLEAGLEAVQGESFQEERLREQGYKKPGEEVIAILRDPATSATKQEGGISAADSFWADLWKKIKNIK